MSLRIRSCSRLVGPIHSRSRIATNFLQRASGRSCNKCHRRYNKNVLEQRVMVHQNGRTDTIFTCIHSMLSSKKHCLSAFVSCRTNSRAILVVELQQPALLTQVIGSGLHSPCSHYPCFQKDPHLQPCYGRMGNSRCPRGAPFRESKWDFNECGGGKPLSVDTHQRTRRSFSAAERPNHYGSSGGCKRDSGEFAMIQIESNIHLLSKIITVVVVVVVIITITILFLPLLLQFRKMKVIMDTQITCWRGSPTSISNIACFAIPVAGMQASFAPLATIVAKSQMGEYGCTGGRELR